MKTALEQSYQQAIEQQKEAEIKRSNQAKPSVGTIS